jgi:hypothetical protein
MEKFPLINMTIDDHEETGVDFIALVDTPAIEREWMAFNAQVPKLEFKVDNEEQRLIMGAIMVADLPIYRRDENIGEYYVRFDADTIKKIVHRYFKNGYTSNVNLDHADKAEGVYLVESFIIDERKRTPEGFAKLPNGSWFGTMKVENDDVWAKVKDGTFRGFSIEGIFTDKSEKELDKKLIDEVIRVLSEA